MGAIGREAQAFVKEMDPAKTVTGTTMQGTSIVLPVGDGQTISIDQSEFAPQSTGDSQYGYTYDNDHFTSLKGIYNEGDEMDYQGPDAKKNLYQDSLLDEPTTVEGNVYKILRMC